MPETASEPIAWARRANGARMFTATRRHYRQPQADRTLCGVAIPARVLTPSRTRTITPLSLTDLSPAEIAAEPECSRCAAIRGRS